MLPFEDASKFHKIDRKKHLQNLWPAWNKTITRLRLSLAICQNTNLDIILLTHWIHHVSVLWKQNPRFYIFCAAKTILLYTEPLWLNKKNINDITTSFNNNDIHVKSKETRILTTIEYKYTNCIYQF